MQRLLYATHQRKWVQEDVWTARFFSLKYLSDLQNPGWSGSDCHLGWIHWMPFQHQNYSIWNTLKMLKSWVSHLVFPPEYNVHNIAGFFPHFSGGGDIVEPVENDLFAIIWWTANQADRERAAIHYIFLSGAHLELCSYVFEEAGLGGKRKESYPLKKIA